MHQSFVHGEMILGIDPALPENGISVLRFFAERVLRHVFLDLHHVYVSQSQTQRKNKLRLRFCVC